LKGEERQGRRGRRPVEKKRGGLSRPRAKGKGEKTPSRGKAFVRTRCSKKRPTRPGDKGRRKKEEKKVNWLP